VSNLAATDITVTLLNQRRVNGRVHLNVQLAFGDSALTYPAGGVPITKAKLACPNVIESLVVYDSGTSGYKWTYDAANEKLVCIQSPVRTHTHDLLLKNAAVADGASARVNAGANLLGANTGGDLTVTGGGANGGVVSTTLAAAAGSQPSTVAIAAQVLRCEVVGW
jgi:hypothetical protein